MIGPALHPKAWGSKTLLAGWTRSQGKYTKLKISRTERSPIGLAYYLQKWFRFHLQDWISRRWRELESKEGVYSLEGWTERRIGNFADSAADGNNPFEEQVVDADGDYRNVHGVTLAADVEMMRREFDLSEMTLEWVRQTEDSLFGDLSIEDRQFLYLYYVREMDRKEIASCLGITEREIPVRLESIRASYIKSNHARQGTDWDPIFVACAYNAGGLNESKGKASQSCPASVVASIYLWVFDLWVIQLADTGAKPIAPALYRLCRIRVASEQYLY